MANNHMSRRGVLQAGGGLAGAVALGSTPAFAQDKRLRMFFWGAKDRADRTDKTNTLYVGKNPDTKIDSEYVGWGDYWTRMATQAAGKNLADVVQMDYRYIFEYARRGALMPLDGFMGKQLNIADFGANSIDCGKVDGKLYGVNLGNNSLAMMINVGFFEENKLEVPKIGTTWKQFVDICAAAAKVKEGLFATADASGAEAGLEVWVRQRGKALYTAEGKLAFTVEDVADWFGFWEDMRSRKLCVPPDVQSLDKDDVGTSSLTVGKSLIAWANSNQLIAYQALNKSRIGISAYPFGEAGSKPGQYLKPSMFFSISANSKMGDDAAKIINFFVKDADAVKALSVERGVPPSSASRSILAPELDELGRTGVAYISAITPAVGALPPPPPLGAGEITKILRSYSEQVAFKKLKVSDGAKAFHADAVIALDR